MHLVNGAIAGYGHIGMTHAENVRNNLRAELCATCSEEKGWPSIESLGVIFYDDWQALLDAETIEGLDAVVIATPTFTHAGFAWMAIEKGLHVFLEKPMEFALETYTAIVLIAWFTGWVPARVFGIVKRLFHDDIDTEDAGMVCITYENGVVASIDPSWNRPAAFPTWGDLTMTLCGTKQTFAIDMFNQVLNVHSNLTAPGTTWSTSGTDSDAEMLSTFVAAIVNDPPPPVSGENGLHALKIAIMAMKQAKTGSRWSGKLW